MTSAPLSRPTLADQIARLAQGYPRLRRTIHPMTVHFSIAFLYAAPFFSFLYLFTGRAGFEAAAFHCLVASVLAGPVALVTGLVSQRLNYPDRDPEFFALERRLSVLLFALCALACLWRALDPAILTSFRPVSLLYLLLVLSLTALVTVISFFGGSLNFPLPPKENL